MQWNVLGFYQIYKVHMCSRVRKCITILNYQHFLFRFDFAVVVLVVVVFVPFFGFLFVCVFVCLFICWVVCMFVCFVCFVLFCERRPYALIGAKLAISVSSTKFPEELFKTILVTQYSISLFEKYDINPRLPKGVVTIP